jgi:exonuclease-1
VKQVTNLSMTQVLQAQNIEYIVAPYEADAQLAYLARNGHVDVVITEVSLPIADHYGMLPMEAYPQGLF